VALNRGTRTEYDPAVYQPLVEVEDHHFWFRARNRVIGALVAQLAARLSPGYRVLEVGCGTGNVLRALTEACPTGTVIGMDLFVDGLRFARARLPNALLVRGDVLHPPFAEQFDIVGMFDVLEHLEDDLGVLRALRRLITDRGRLIMTVPAGHALWSYFDEASRHVRRYEIAELSDKLTRAGFEVEFLSPYMGVLYPVLWLGRRLARGKYQPGGDREMTRRLFDRELRVSPVAGAALGAMLRLERPWLLRHGRLPIGSSLIAIARPIGGAGAR
jgi:SAM-dependent methyltransferase